MIYCKFTTQSRSRTETEEACKAMIGSVCSCHGDIATEAVEAAVLPNGESEERMNEDLIRGHRFYAATVR